MLVDVNPTQGLRGTILKLENNSKESYKKGNVFPKAENHKTNTPPPIGNYLTRVNMKVFVLNLIMYDELGRTFLYSYLISIMLIKNLFYFLLRALSI